MPGFQMVMDTDDDLPRRLAADLPGAFPALVAGHADRLYTIALRLLGNAADAEEVTQDALVRAYRALDAWPPDRVRELRLRAWLATIVVNAARTRARRRARTRATETALEPPTADGTTRPAAEPVASRADEPDAAAAGRETSAELAAHVAALPDRYRVAVVLRHVDGLSYAEMADALEVPEGTLKAQVHRGLALLRAALDASARAHATARRDPTGAPVPPTNRPTRAPVALSPEAAR